MNATKTQIKRHIIKFEQVLGVKFPESYSQFLLDQNSCQIANYKIFGIPTKEVETSVFQATEYLRKNRPDLVRTLVVVCLKKNRADGKEKALCMDLTNNHQDDAPLVEVSDVNEEKQDNPRRLFFCLTEKTK